MPMRRRVPLTQHELIGPLVVGTVTNSPRKCGRIAHFSEPDLSLARSYFWTVIGLVELEIALVRRQNLIAVADRDIPHCQCATAEGAAADDLVGAAALEQPA